MAGAGVGGPSRDKDGTREKQREGGREDGPRPSSQPVVARKRENGFASPQRFGAKLSAHPMKNRNKNKNKPGLSVELAGCTSGPGATGRPHAPCRAGSLPTPGVEWI